MSPSAYDGTYGGMTSATHYAASSCGKMTPAPAKFTVQNGSVVWQPVPGTVLYAPIMQNGTFYAAYGNTMMLSGKVTPTGLVARTSDGSCHITSDLKRQPV